MRVLGFMSGTSLDAIDMAVLETDGESLAAFGPAGEAPLPASTRRLIVAATDAARTWARGSPEPPVFAEAAQAVAEAHLAAARMFFEDHGLAASDLDLVGFHGQTVLHERPVPGLPGRTVQLGDAERLACSLGLPVAFDFRSADVLAGGEGAPLAPIYHAARAIASGLSAPLAVLNLGGVANVTLIGMDAGLQAFDTGPANGMIDLFVQSRTPLRCDEDGRLAAAGAVDEEALRRLLDHPYFEAPPPKSLDRFDFPLAPVERLSLEDGAATLTAFAARSLALGLGRLDPPPRRLVVSGGGRRNPSLMAAIRTACVVELVAADDLGWRGDAIEAEAFAYLAARTARGLPISFPATTGAPRPMTGGRIVQPPGSSAAMRLSR